ncbi:hypothetical protein [Streptomyces anthocyanicus]|uniref:hypothetical protein n=1 Tax=Streptomyces anthocyanicus TaxID=68174 RepID=UPI0038064ABE
MQKDTGRPIGRPDHQEPPPTRLLRPRCRHPLHRRHRAGPLRRMGRGRPHRSPQRPQPVPHRAPRRRTPRAGTAQGDVPAGRRRASSTVASRPTSLLVPCTCSWE